jgi:hypothetical protein
MRRSADDDVCMRTPDQDERAESDTAPPALDDGFGGPDVAGGDLNDGYGSHSFYGDADDDATPDDDGGDTSLNDDTFNDAGDDHGGFGGTGAADTGDGGDDSGEAAGGFNGGDVSEAQAENILTDILDNVFGDDADDVVEDMEDSYGVDATDLLTALGDTYGTDDGSGATDDGSGVFDNPFDGADGGGVGDVGDAADMVTGTDLDLTGDGHVNHADLSEAAHPFDFHVDPG